MRFGLFLIAARFPGQDPGSVLERTVAAIAAAEDAGFADAWIAEHHFMDYGVCPSATTLAAYALGRTSRIEVGTAVSVLSTHHPVALAEQAAVLDLVSGGRFRLGVGRGGPWVDLEVFGTGLGRYEQGFPESLDLLLAALTRSTVRGDGPAFRFREVPMVPRARSVRPVVACTSPGTVTLAAARGLPMLLGMHIGDAEKAEMINEYGAAGPGVRHIAAAVAHVEDSTAGARETLRASLPRWLIPGLAGYIPVDDRSRPSRDIAKYVDRLCDIHPVGSADHCIDKIIETRDRTGVEHLIFMVEGTGDTARTLETIARLGSEVITDPRLTTPPKPA